MVDAFKIASSVIVIAEISLLISAAWRDVAVRLIPNRICLILALFGIANRLLLGPLDLAISLGLAAGVFFSLSMLFFFGVVGGGDVKLWAALAAGLSPLTLMHSLSVTLLAGGLLAMLHLAMRHLPRPSASTNNASALRRVCAVERWRILRHAPLPYGVAIACGGIWVMLPAIGA